MGDYLAIAATAGISFVVNMLATPVLLRLAHRFSWYDEIDHRKIHTGDVPRIGGIGIIVSFTVGTFLYLLLYTSANGPLTLDPIKRFLPFFIAAWIIHLAGLIDDFFNLRALHKLIIQILAACVVAFTANPLQDLYVPFLDRIVHIGYAGYPLTILWVVGACNAVNLIDGMDGLAGGSSAISACAVSIIFLFIGNYTAGLIGFTLVGSVIAFLFFNLPKAKLFMGDSGSMLLGFCLSTLPLIGITGEYAPSTLLISITVILIPILDTLAAILRRLQKNLPIHSPDKEHLHHKLLDFGLPKAAILSIVYGGTILLGTSVILWIVYPGPLFPAIIIALWGVFILMFVILNRMNLRRHRLSTG